MNLCADWVEHNPALIHALVKSAHSIKSLINALETRVIINVVQIQRKLNRFIPFTQRFVSLPSNMYCEAQSESEG